MKLKSRQFGCKYFKLAITEIENVPERALELVSERGFRSDTISHHLDPETNSLDPMDDPFTETVIGTERVAAILQGVSSVFDSKDYHSLIDKIHQFVAPHDSSPALIRESECVNADHLKALYGLVADRAPPPGKNGRERIVKLLIRKVLTRLTLLGIRSPNLMSAMLLSLSNINGNGHHRAEETIENLTDYINTESHRFQNTLERGQRRLERILTENQGKTLTGSQIVSLEKKWGVPHLLTAAILPKKGLEFASAEYEEELTHWKQSLEN